MALAPIGNKRIERNHLPRDAWLSRGNTGWRLHLICIVGLPYKIIGKPMARRNETSAFLNPVKKTFLCALTHRAG